ncbi:hypothetical protein D3C77_326760 [compost metagenome]
MRIAAGATIDEIAVDDVRPGEDVVDVLRTRHVGLHVQRALRPVDHAPVDCREIAQQRPSLGLALQVQVAQVARLLAAYTVRHKLVAVLRDAVHLPLVDHPGLNALPQAEPVVNAQAIRGPNRVVGPGLLESTIPHACVGARHRVVVAGHRPALRLAVDRYRWDVMELLGIELDVKQRCIRVAQLVVDDLGVTRDQHLVRNRAAVGVWRDAANPEGPPGGGRRQADRLRSLVAIGGLAVNSTTKGLDKCPAVGRNVDGVLDAIAVRAVVVLTGKAGPGEPHAESGELEIAQGAGEGRVATQLDVYRRLVLDSRNTLNVILFDRAWAPLPLDPGEVHIAAGIHDRRVIQVDITVRRGFVKLPLTHRQQDLGDVRRLQAIRRLNRTFRFLLATFGAGDFWQKCCAHAFLRAIKNRPEAVGGV